MNVLKLADGAARVRPTIHYSQLAMVDLRPSLFGSDERVYA